MNQYSMMIQWSNEDRPFLVTIPEFAERFVMPCTHGKTHEVVFNPVSESPIYFIRKDIGKQEKTTFYTK